MTKYKIILYYNFVEIKDTELLMNQQRALCQKLNIKGRILISPTQGINSTLEGEETDINQYLEEFKSDPRFSDTDIKISDGIGDAFPKLSVKVRDEIVTTSLEYKNLIGPGKTTGKYLSADDLHQWYLAKKEFYVIDMRNDYEYEVGHFKNAIWAPDMSHFRDMPKMLDKIDHLKDKTVVTTCTGGVRCELASGFLMKHGFTDVYQLHNGIQTYMQKYPNGFFKGKLYVFDGRVIWAPKEAEDEIIGKCRVCGEASEHLVNWNDGSGERRHGIICQTCCKEGKVELQPGYRRKIMESVK